MSGEEASDHQRKTGDPEDTAETGNFEYLRFGPVKRSYNQRPPNLRTTTLQTNLLLAISKRVLATVVSGALLLLLAACSQQPQDVDSIARGQSVPFTEMPVAATDGSAITSPYAGQETRRIKSLSTEDIEGLLAGSGTPFGGMAKPAELNGYPGPRHVLDAVEAGEFTVTAQQMEQIKSLYELMRSDAVEIGKHIIELETTVDDALAKKNITAELLQEKILASGSLYGQLRLVHLETHLSMVDILTPHQVEQYNELRGYTSGNPCDNIPEGHSPEPWNKHNNCS